MRTVTVQLSRFRSALHVPITAFGRNCLDMQIRSSAVLPSVGERAQPAQ